MAKQPIVEVEGARQLRASLKKAGADLASLNRVHSQVAHIVEKAAQSRVPRRSGRLAGTIRTAGQRRAAVIRVGRKAVPYAGPIHWGWHARHIQPRRFLTGAAKATEPQWVGVYKREIKNIIRQVKGL